jgi:hypothetical protein
MANAGTITDDDPRGILAGRSCPLQLPEGTLIVFDPVTHRATALSWRSGHRNNTDKVSVNTV